MPDRVAFTIFGLDILWYGVLVASGFALGAMVFYLRGPRRGISHEAVLDILIFSLPAAILCARIYYVVFNWDYYDADLLEIINIRGGGLAIHGGLAGGLLTAWLVARRKRIHFLSVADAVVPGIALGQAIGRWGNYFNGEAHGGPTDLPWAITVAGEKVHPTFLYESVWCFLLFLFLLAFDRKPRFLGQIFCLYGMLYSVERFLVEGLRTDSLMLGPFRVAQLVSLAAILACGALYAYQLKKSREHKQFSGMNE